MEEKKIYLTSEGFLKLEEELDTLKKIKRKEVVEALKEARALGDLSENSEYDAAREEQAKIEGRIKELEFMVENAVIIEKEKSDTIQIGSIVKILYMSDNEVEEYTIVGSQEADPFENKISNEAPLAKAILGHKTNDVVEVLSPNGDYTVKIKEIK